MQSAKLSYRFLLTPWNFIMRCAQQKGSASRTFVIHISQNIQAVRSTQSLEVPLVHNGELMVSDEVSFFAVQYILPHLNTQSTPYLRTLAFETPCPSEFPKGWGRGGGGSSMNVLWNWTVSTICLFNKR